eukprot:jgi/Chlat1/4616/Chrsp293S00813
MGASLSDNALVRSIRALIRSPFQHSRLEEAVLPITPAESGDDQITTSPSEHHNRQFRRLHIKDFSERADKKKRLEYVGNSITTSKYTALTFLPVNLFQQFCRVIPGLTPTSPVGTIFPLAVVLTVNGCKEAWDDYARHQSDRAVNGRKVKALRGADWVNIPWLEVEVGDVLRVERDQEFPADLVFLASSDAQGFAYIETANLDGETNLKIKNAFSDSGHLQFPSELYQLCNPERKVRVDCEQPNNRLYQFEGSINMSPGAKACPLDVGHLLLRGSTLRNTSWTLGLVVFTGVDTKLMRNTLHTPRKVSQLERSMNYLVSGMFAFVGILALISALGNTIWAGSARGSYIYVSGSWPDLKGGFSSFWVQWLRFIILFNQLIPISLYVTLEMVKVGQCMFINRDIHMYHEETDTPAKTRTSNLNEELGQTGTLTQNLMAFVQCSIAGVLYRGVIGTHSPPPDTTTTKTPHTVALDPALKDMLKDGRVGGDAVVSVDNVGEATHTHAEQCCHFYKVLAMCHTVVPTVSEDDQKTIRYQAASPDEEALVSRTNEEVVVEAPGWRRYRAKVLALLEFNSDRKRMSIVLREEDTGRIRLYCKGADTVIYARLAPGQAAAAPTAEHLSGFARTGYRTLCIAMKELSEEDYAVWSAQFRSASLSLEGREEKIAALAERVETDLTLLGATAVEDKLQDGVPEAIRSLGEAGIKIWLLTGDKVETAVSIALSCNLLREPMLRVMATESAVGGEKHASAFLENAIAEAKSARAADSQKEIGVVVDGAVLEWMLDAKRAAQFLELCLVCQAVVCCRVSPLQKAQVTRLVKTHAHAVTLGIGDGANDVGMIKAAHIGVGISGREGRAAVLASDYAVAQFRHLVQLLLVHGRWSYSRNRELVLYAFYKNIVYVGGNFYLAWLSGFSSQPLYTTALISTYNLAWTALPTVAYAFLEQDVTASTFFRSALSWLYTGVGHSALCFFASLLSVGDVVTTEGRELGLYALGAVSYSCVVFVVNLRLAVRSRFWSWPNALAVFGTAMGAWVVFLFFCSFIWEAAQVFPYMDHLAHQIYAQDSFWLCLFLVSAIAVLVDIAVAAMSLQFNPQPNDIFMEIENGWKNGVKASQGASPTAVHHISSEQELLTP